MAEAPVYRRTELPAGQTGLVKPGFELADTSSQQRFGRVIEGAAGDIWSKIIQADAANEQAEFVGLVKAKETEYEAKVAAAPGAPFEDYQAWQNDLLTEIKVAGAKARTGIAKEWIRNWYAQNEKTIKETLNASTQAIEAKRQEERFNLQAKAAVKGGDVGTLKTLYEGVRDNLYPAELVDLMFEQDAATAEYNAAMKWVGMAPQPAVEQLDKAIESGGKLKGYERLEPGQLRALRDIAEARISITDLAAKQQQQADENKIYDAIYGPKNVGALAGVEEQIRLMASFDADTKEKWRKRLFDHIKQLQGTGPDSPYEKTMNPAKKQELLEKAVRDDIRLDEVEKWVGKKDGISISDGQEIRRLLEDDAHILKSSQVQAWFSKLKNDFGGVKQDPVRHAEYGEMLRRYYLDYERQNKKLPSDREVAEFYDKNFVEHRVREWIEKRWSNIKTGARWGAIGGTMGSYGVGRTMGRQLMDWAAREEEPEISDLTSQTGPAAGQTVPALEELRKPYILGDSFRRKGKVYKIVSFRESDGMPMVEEVR